MWKDAVWERVTAWGRDGRGRGSIHGIYFNGISTAPHCCDNTSAFHMNNKWNHVITCHPCHWHNNPWLVKDKTTTSTELLLLGTALLHKFTVIVFHFVDIKWFCPWQNQHIRHNFVSNSHKQYTYTHTVSQNKQQHHINCLITYNIISFPSHFSLAVFPHFVFSSFCTCKAKTDLPQFLYQCNHNQEINK